MSTDSSIVDTVLADYVAGNLADPARVLIESHLEIAPDNRQWAADLEAVHGIEVSESKEAGLNDRASMLDTIFKTGTPDWAAADVPSGDTGQDGMLPNALQNYIGKDLDDLAWRRVIPGLKEASVETADGVEAKFLRIRAGQAMPTHTHHGNEMTLVLQGAFSDSSGRYGRGDISIADEDVDHKPVAEPGEDCICFVVCDAPLELTGPIGRWFAPFVNRQSR